MEAFIESVRAQPCLWNPLHPDYREMHMKDEAWQCVVDQNNDSSIPNITIAKSEWKKLRDNHRDALKRAKLGKNKLLPAQITTWKYAKHMQFLEPHMKYRITEHIDMEPISDSGPKRQRDVSASTPSTEPSTAAPPAKRRCPDRAIESDPAPSFRKDPDALESFFNCILKSTREMPPWMQTQVKKNIFAVIIDAEEQLSSRQTGSPDQSCEDQPRENKIKCEVITDDY
ncbi:uncharacterized protein LOC134678085 [Cydia fagiglandana]|uniref:uncharacterized protein LOC134678085 n=1 Tax=Cydia fagiglandana TaxID=1458189 RepID=UPI002FEE1114